MTNILFTNLYKEFNIQLNLLNSNSKNDINIENIFIKYIEINTIKVLMIKIKINYEKF